MIVRLVIWVLLILLARTHAFGDEHTWRLSGKPKRGPPICHLFDAKDLIMGRLASKIAKLMRDQHAPFYNLEPVEGEYVVVVNNAALVRFSGNKWKEKVYVWNKTQRVGGTKRRTAEQQLNIEPTQILHKAVWGMLPTNRLRKHMMRRLKIFPYEFSTTEAVDNWGPPPYFDYSVPEPRL